jgi:hypothetical protein
MTIHKEGRAILFISLIVLFGINWAVMYYYPNSVEHRSVPVDPSVLPQPDLPDLKE